MMTKSENEKLAFDRCNFASFLVFDPDLKKRVERFFKDGTNFWRDAFEKRLVYNAAKDRGFDPEYLGLPAA